MGWVLDWWAQHSASMNVYMLDKFGSIWVFGSSAPFFHIALNASSVIHFGSFMFFMFRRVAEEVLAWSGSSSID